MSANVIKFPVLCIHRNYAVVRYSPDELTTTTKYGLKHGEYDGLLIIDCQGIAIKVTGARKLHGAGFLGGFNLFLNQRIKVELKHSGEPFQLRLEEVKERIFESFETWHGWTASENFDDIKKGVEKASSVEEIFAVIAS